MSYNKKLLKSNLSLKQLIFNLIYNEIRKLNKVKKSFTTNNWIITTIDKVLLLEITKYFLLN